MTYKNIALSALAAAALTFTGCGGGGSTDGGGGSSDGGTTTTDVVPVTGTTLTKGTAPVAATGASTTGTCATGTSADYVETLSGVISADKTLLADTVYKLEGKVEVNGGATLTIEAGATIAGVPGEAASTSFLIVNKDAVIKANGTAAKPVCFTSTTAYEGGAAAEGQWGGVTIIGTETGNDQLSGYEIDESYVAGTGISDQSVMNHVMVLNSGITMSEDKEINGLSFVGVTGGTYQDITVINSDDDCIELWGGSVNLTNITLENCTDDQFDIDDGFSGTVTNLLITQTSGNAGMEMSGNTAATFEGLTINSTSTAKEGGIYFKKDGVGGTFNNVTVNYNDAGATDGAIHSSGAIDTDNLSFSNVSITSASENLITGASQDDVDALQAALQ